VGRLQEIFCRGEIDPIDRLLQIFSEEGREFIKWDEFHPVIKIDLTGAWNAPNHFAQGWSGEVLTASGR
jgi:hypothetical protein